VALRGCALRGGSAGSGSQGGTVFAYAGSGAAIQVGDPAYTSDTPGFHLDNVAINTTGATSATAQGLIAYRTQELDLENLYFLGNANQTGMTLDGTGNYTGGTFLDDEFNGFGAAVNAIGHQVANPATTDWVNASTFVRLHIDCPTSSSNPIAGTYGINLQQGDGNTFTGGDVEGCATALHLGANAQNNTIVGLRNENSTSQVVADAGSSYNSWTSGGTMFTGELTDNGTRNSFLDTFHRSFNALNGDWYGSQQDATVTNHYRLGTGAGNERGLLDEYQTDSGYRWTLGLSDATAGEQFYQILDQLNNVYRFEIDQYNNGASGTNNQTVINAAGTGAVVLNGSNNAGTGGVVVGSGGSSESTVATISNAGNAQFNGTLQVGSTAQSAGNHDRAQQRGCRSGLQPVAGTDGEPEGIVHLQRLERQQPVVSAQGREQQLGAELGRRRTRQLQGLPEHKQWRHLRRRQQCNRPRPAEFRARIGSGDRHLFERHSRHESVGNHVHRISRPRRGQRNQLLTGGQLRLSEQHRRSMRIRQRRQRQRHGELGDHRSDCLLRRKRSSGRR
jgi:hypothetical protein